MSLISQRRMTKPMIDHVRALEDPVFKIRAKISKKNSKAQFQSRFK